MELEGYDYIGSAYQDDIYSTLAALNDTHYSEIYISSNSLP